jgi:DNA-binding IclR family transcriptional regulator
MSPRDPNSKPIGAVKSAARVLDVLELLLAKRRALSLTEMSQELSIPMSSLHELVQTLSAREYLLRHEGEYTYGLGPKLAQYAHAYLEAAEVVENARRVMEHMHLLCGESVSLAVPELREVVFVSKWTSPQLVRVVNPVGSRLPLHATALGKSILALMPEAELHRLYPEESLERLTPNTLGTKTELLHRLTAVREAGVAFDREESTLGLWAVSSAIRDASGCGVAAISIALPSTRVTPESEARLAELVRVGAAVVSWQLGFEGDSLGLAKTMDVLDAAWAGGLPRT